MRDVEELKRELRKIQLKAKVRRKLYEQYKEETNEQKKKELEVALCWTL